MMGFSLNFLFNLPLFLHLYGAFTLSSADADASRFSEFKHSFFRFFPFFLSFILDSKAFELSVLNRKEKQPTIFNKKLSGWHFFDARCSDSDWNKWNAIRFSWPVTVDKKTKRIRENERGRARASEWTLLKHQQLHWPWSRIFYFVELASFDFFFLHVVVILVVVLFKSRSFFVHFRLHLIHLNDEMEWALAHFRLSNLNLIYRYFVNGLTASVIDVKQKLMTNSLSLPRAPSRNWVPNSFRFNEIRWESFWLRKRNGEPIGGKNPLVEWQNSLSI